MRPTWSSLSLHDDIDGGFVELGVLAQGKSDVFADGHRAEERALLKRHAHFLENFLALGLGDRGEVLSLDLYFAAAGALETDESAEERAFAGAGAAENDERLAGGNLEADAVQDFASAVLHAKVANGDRAFRRSVGRVVFGDEVRCHSL